MYSFFCRVLSKSSATNTMSLCVACKDEDNTVVFMCKGNGGSCSYMLCAGCVRRAFDDQSGANSSFCFTCKTPTALDMIAAVCGKGAIVAVEEKLRSKVEFQCREQNMKAAVSR